MAKRLRAPVPCDVSVRVFYRDGWLCRWCHRPVVFAPALHLLQGFVAGAGSSGPAAYFHPNWSRAGAPLLDHLGAVIDHVEAFARGGAHDETNFVTACNKCNTRKNARAAEAYELERPGKPVRGKYGEPKSWDGLVAVFLAFADRGAPLDPSERRWAEALRKHLAARVAAP